MKYSEVFGIAAREIGWGEQVIQYAEIHAKIENPKDGDGEVAPGQERPLIEATKAVLRQLETSSSFRRLILEAHDKEQAEKTKRN